MAKKLIVTNEHSTKTLFQERQYYKINVLSPKDHKNVIDFWNPVYANYGKVNLDNQKIRVDTKFLKELNSEKKDATYYAVNFVADAFNDLWDYCRAGAVGPGSLIIPSDSRYSKIDPKTQNQWEPSTKAYERHLMRVFRPFTASYLQYYKHKKSIRNINDFMEMFLKFARDVKLTVPVTKTGFLESGFGSMNHNGLLIEIDNSKSHDKDTIKQKWIDDPGFNFWMRGCALHGFLVDRNAPWRIIANLESHALSRYTKEYNVKSLADIFDTYFSPAFMDDIVNLKNYIYNFYLAYTRFEPYYIEKEFLINHKRTVVKKIYKEHANRDSFLRRHADSYWLRYWFILRSHELGIKFSTKEQSTILRTAFKIERELDLQSAIAYTVRVLQKRAGFGADPEKSFIRRDGDRQLIIKT